VLSMPAALLLGMIVFLLITGIGRSHEGAEHARASRYLGVQAALAIPALALGASGLVRRWRVLGPVMVVLLLIGIPGNVAKANDFSKSLTRYDTLRHSAEAIARLPEARLVPRSLQPDVQLPNVTVGWLLDGAASGRIPRARPSTPREAAGDLLRLSVMQTDGRVEPPCRSLDKPVYLHLLKGQSIGIKGGLLGVLETTPPNGVATKVILGQTPFQRSKGHILTATFRSLNVQLHEWHLAGQVHASNPIVQLCSIAPR
jgi:hypothetical protein